MPQGYPIAGDILDIEINGVTTTVTVLRRNPKNCKVQTDDGKHYNMRNTYPHTWIGTAEPEELASLKNPNQISLTVGAPVRIKSRKFTGNGTIVKVNHQRVKVSIKDYGIVNCPVSILYPIASSAAGE